MLKNIRFYKVFRNRKVRSKSEKRKVHFSLFDFTFHFSISLLTFRFHFSLFDCTFRFCSGPCGSSGFLGSLRGSSGFFGAFQFTFGVLRCSSGLFRIPQVSSGHFNSQLGFFGVRRDSSGFLRSLLGISITIWGSSEFFGANGLWSYRFYV